MSSFKKIKKASKYADCKNSGKGSLLKYYGVKTERRVFYVFFLVLSLPFLPSSSEIIIYVKTSYFKAVTFVNFDLCLNKL